MRLLDPTFFKELKAGSLTPLLEYVIADNTLDLEIRKNYINIYYRGGNILDVKMKKSGFLFHFEEKYFKKDPLIKADIDKYKIARDWNKFFPIAKQAMDIYFTTHTKQEREYQQLVIRENNNSSIANGTDYFIIDIEYDNSDKSRFDLIAIEWPSVGSLRKAPIHFTPKLLIIEMKYGDHALSGGAGMLKHWADFHRFISNPIANAKFKIEMLNLFSQKRQLGLIPCLPPEQNRNPILKFDDTIELAFLITNHDPASTKLKTELSSLGAVPAKFITSNFMGYGIYNESVYTLVDFKARFKNQF